MREGDQKNENENKEEVVGVKKNRCLVFALTALSACAMLGILGIVAVIKSHLKEELGIQEDFFGILDGQLFIMQILGCLYIIFNPTNNQKRRFLISSIAQFLALSLVALCPLAPSISKGLLLVAYFISGFQRAFISVLQNIIMSYYPNQEDATMVNLWYGFFPLGDIVAVLLMAFMVKINLYWAIGFEFYLVLYLILAFLVYCFSEEPVNSEQSEGISDRGKELIKQFYKRKSNYVLTFQMVLIIIPYYTALLWLPFYFNSIGYKFVGAVIAILYPLAEFIIIPLYSILVEKFPQRKQMIRGTCFSIYLVTSIWLIFIGTDKEDMIKYMIGIFVLGLMEGGPAAEVWGNLIYERCDFDHEKYHYINVFIILLEPFGAGLVMIIVGYFMKINSRSFFISLTVIFGLILILHFIRLIVEKNQTQDEQRVPLQQQEEQLEQPDQKEIPIPQ